MAQQGDRDDMDRDLPLADEDARAVADEEFEDVEEGDEAEEDEDEFAEDEPTGEVGSEGGSPGETERVRKPQP